MNYLAHIYLSGEEDAVIFGNFIADAIRGKAFKNYSPSVQQGILLHRSIDTFTDTHPIFRKHAKLFFKAHSHYSRVILDVLYDHLLAKNWEKYHAQDLHSFSQDFYEMTSNFSEPLPPKMTLFFEKMHTQNWLYEYAEISGIERILMHMSKRTSFASNFPAAVPLFLEHMATMETEFFDFFEALKLHASLTRVRLEKS